MPAKYKRRPRFNVFSVGRAAVLFSRGFSRTQVAGYYHERYGEAWKMGSQAATAEFLFKGRGMRPNFANLFDGKPNQEVRGNFRLCMARLNAGRERSARFWSDPKRASFHAQKIASGLRRKWRDPKYAARVKKHIRKMNSNSDVQRARSRKHWDNPQCVAAHSKRMSKQNKENWADPNWRSLQIWRLRRRKSAVGHSVISSLKDRGLEHTYGSAGCDLSVLFPPEAVMEREEVVTKVRTALTLLPDVQRKLIKMLVFFGRTPIEASSATGLSIKQVEREFVAAQAVLANALADFDDYDQPISA